MSRKEAEALPTMDDRDLRPRIGPAQAEAPAETWPTKESEAYWGLAGRIVRAIDPYTEADPVAVLLHVLLGVGNVVGPGLHSPVESMRHGLNEFAVLVGRTSKARKGQAWATPRKLLLAVDNDWALTRIKHGLSSGEGVIYHVRDRREEQRSI